MELAEPLWIVPISIIPGLGMLVLSTSSRYVTVTLQLREQGKADSPDFWLSELIFRRACCLQQALLSLYLSTASFILASLLIAMASLYGSLVPVSQFAMLLGGLLAMYSSVHLVYEVFASRKIIKRDYAKLRSDLEEVR